LHKYKLKIPSFAFKHRGAHKICYSCYYTNMALAVIGIYNGPTKMISAVLCDFSLSAAVVLNWQVVYKCQQQYIVHTVNCNVFQMQHWWTGL